MTDRLEQKKQHRLLVLEALYDELDGESGEAVYTERLSELMAKRGVSSSDVESAFSWLCKEGLAERHAAELIGITHYGVREVEDAREKPDEDTEHFPAAVIHQVNNFYGNVGGVQNGSNNTMNVKQTVGKSQSSHLDALFQALHSTIATLPKDVQSDATDVATALESEARSEVPKLPLIKAYVRELKDASVEVSESATNVMNWCLENFCQK